MGKTIELLLTETVEHLGIVGDVVSVKAGYARNYLLPHDMATEPSEEKIKALAEKRALAERELSERRTRMQTMIEKLGGFELTIERSCNDQGQLYGSVTQQDIATLLVEQGFGVRPRDVRLVQTIKHIDSYEVTIRPEPDLEAVIKLWVVSDRPLDLPEDEAAGAQDGDAEPAEAAAPDEQVDEASSLSA